MVWTTDRLVDSDIEDEVGHRIPAVAPGRRTLTMSLAPVQRFARGDLPVATSADVGWAPDRAPGPEVARAIDDPFDFRFPSRTSPQRSRAG